MVFLMRHTGRKVAYGVAILFFAAGIFLLITAHKYRCNFHQWREARPVDLTVDLSAPGEFKGTFQQTCHISHGEEICLILPPDRSPTIPLTTLFSEVRFICRIIDGDGNEKLSQEFTGELVYGDSRICDDRFPGAAIPLLKFHPFEDGAYQMLVSVKNGTPALHDVPQRIIGRYLLCGLEMMPAFLSMIAGIASMLVAAVVAVTTALVSRRKIKNSNCACPGHLANTGTSEPSPDREGGGL